MTTPRDPFDDWSRDDRRSDDRRSDDPRGDDRRGDDPRGDDPRREQPQNRRSDDAEEQLRLSLARHAGEAPDGGLLAERILHAVDRQSRVVAPPRRIRWAAPLAAAAVLVVLAGVIVAISQFGRNSHPQPVAESGSRVVSGSHSPSTPPTPSAPTSSASLQSPTTAIAVPAHPTLTGVHIQDLTFDATDDGWVLGTAVCLDGSGGRCTALLHTSNGTNWESRSGSAFNVPEVTGGCATKCVTNIRFADDMTGYAYGPSAFFMTTDGGHNWVQQPGGAIALETVNQNVIRVTSTGTGCSGPCGIQVQTAGIASTTWTTRALGRPADAAAANVYLSRGGSDAYVLVTRNPAGGASVETSTLYRSADNGTSWTSSGEPCGQGNSEVDSTAIAAGLDGGVTVLCTTRQAPRSSTVHVSTNGGVDFHATSGTVPSATAQLLAGDATTVLLTGDHGLARSTNGGASWHVSSMVTGSVGFIGFESTTVGRAVTGANTIWTTRNGGVTWSASRLG